MVTPSSLLRRGLICLLGAVFLLTGCEQPTPERGVEQWTRTFLEAQHDATRCARLMGPALQFVCGNVHQLGYLNASINGEEVSLVWRAGKEMRPAIHEHLRPQLTRGRLVAIAGPALPLWLVEPVEITARNQLVILAGREVANIDAVIEAATLARERLQQIPLGQLGIDDSSPVIVVPTRWDTRLIPASVNPATAALSWPFGRQDPAFHIFINPTAPSTGLAATVNHELAHLVTRNAAWSPAWLCEGLAEYLAVPQETLRERAQAYVQTRGVPTIFPTDATIAAASTLESYTLSAWIIVVLVEHVGWDQARQIIAERAAGKPSTVTDAQWQAWWRQSLSALG